jgi:hypothetical protein
MSKQDQFAKLKAAFGKRSEGGGSTENNGFWDKFYPFFKMAFDDVAVFRFLPDLDEENPLGFVVENKYHELTINGKKKRVACLTMYGKRCPCCEASQKYYNELGDEKLGKLFWRKIDFVAQGLVISSPFEYEMKPEDNPVRLISLGPKLFKKIESSVLSGDFDVSPTDLVDGYDFRITKSRQGEYAAYDNSEFARRSTPVADATLAKMKLYNLNDFRYGEIPEAQMEAMIEAVLTGRTYDDKKAADQQGQGHSTGNAALDQKLNADKPTADIGSVVASTTGQSSASQEQASQPADGGSAGGRAAEILARLRNRNG